MSLFFVITHRLCHSSSEYFQQKHYRTKWGHTISKFSHGWQEIYQIFFILLKNIWYIFCKLCIIFRCHDTQKVARHFAWNFIFNISDCQPLLQNCSVSPALHLWALPCPTLHYIFLQSQPCPNLPCSAILTIHVLLVLAWSINWWNIQQKCGE